MKKNLHILHKMVSWIAMLVIMITSVPLFSMNQLVVQASSTEDVFDGSLAITLPTDSDYRYSIDIQLIKYNESDDAVSNEWSHKLFVNNVEFELTNGEAILSNNEQGYTHGETVTITNIPTSGTAYADPFVRTEMVVKIICSNVIYEVKLNAQPSATVAITTNTTLSPSYTIEENTSLKDINVTSNDFESLGGAYTYLHLINNYNVVATAGDIESTHLVGAILSAGRAFGTIDVGSFSDTIPNDTRNYIESPLVVSDYSRSIFSYVAELEGYDHTTPTFKLNYGFDASGGPLTNSSDAPALYTYSSDKYILNFGIDDIKQYVQLEAPVPSTSTDLFLSPNYSGYGQIYKNDSFIDFSRVESALSYTTENLVTYLGEEISEITTIDATGLTEIEIESGKSYKIINATGVQTVDIILPAGYDFFLNPYPEPTIISFSGDIQTTTIGGVSHYVFPAVTVNGTTLSAPTGKDGEYGERGNKIVWHFPDLTTETDTGVGRMTLGTIGQNIPGHILAPNVEIWHYAADGDANFTWLGGNLNGSAMVKAFHSGVMEIHMFAYDGREETGVIIRAEKTVDSTTTGLNTGEYTFEMSLAANQTEDGILNGSDSKPDFPLSAQVQSDGSITFPALSFSKAGTYNFIVKETIPETKASNISYDLSEYTITVTVEEVTTYSMDTTYTTMTTSYTITKTVDEHGNMIASPTTVDAITFNNTTGYSTTLYKKNTENTGLSGAIFQVTESDSVGVPVSGGTSYTVTSNASGEIIISSLEADSYYKVVETKAPDGYALPTDAYYIVSVGASGGITIENQDKQTLTDFIIINELEDFKLPNTGGIGTTLYYVFGMACFASGIFIISNMRKRKVGKGEIYE